MLTGRVELRDGALSASIDSQAGARLASVQFGGVEVLLTEGSSPISWGCFVMAPWAGRLTGDGFSYGGRRYQMPRTYLDRAIHGLVLDSPFTVLSQSSRQAVLETRIGDDWPWDGIVRASYELRSPELHIELEIAAEGSRTGSGEAFPVSCGLHPWFRRTLGDSPEADIVMDGASMLELREDFALTGRKVDVPPGPWDDTFEVPSHSVSLRWPGQMSIAIASPTPWFVVFTENLDGVCAEPQSGTPDALNDPLGVGVDVAEPGRPFRWASTWTFGRDV